MFYSEHNIQTSVWPLL